MTRLFARCPDCKQRQLMTIFDPPLLCGSATKMAEPKRLGRTPQLLFERVGGTLRANQTGPLPDLPTKWSDSVSI